MGLILHFRNVLCFKGLSINNVRIRGQRPITNKKKYVKIFPTQNEYIRWMSIWGEIGMLTLAPWIGDLC